MKVGQIRRGPPGSNRCPKIYVTPASTEDVPVEIPERTIMAQAWLYEDMWVHYQHQHRWVSRLRLCPYGKPDVDASYWRWGFFERMHKTFFWVTPADGGDNIWGLPSAWLEATELPSSEETTAERIWVTYRAGISENPEKKCLQMIYVKYGTGSGSHASDTMFTKAQGDGMDWRWNRNAGVADTACPVMNAGLELVASPKLDVAPAWAIPETYAPLRSDSSGSSSDSSCVDLCTVGDLVPEAVTLCVRRIANRSVICDECWTVERLRVAMGLEDTAAPPERNWFVTDDMTRSDELGGGVSRSVERSVAVKAEIDYIDQEVNTPSMPCFDLCATIATASDAPSISDAHVEQTDSLQLWVAKQDDDSVAASSSGIMFASDESGDEDIAKIELPVKSLWDWWDEPASVGRCPEVEADVDCIEQVVSAPSMTDFSRCTTVVAESDENRTSDPRMKFDDPIGNLKVYVTGHDGPTVAASSSENEEQRDEKRGDIVSVRTPSLWGWWNSGVSASAVAWLARRGTLETTISTVCKRCVWQTGRNRQKFLAVLEQMAIATHTSGTVRSAAITTWCGERAICGSRLQAVDQDRIFIIIVPVDSHPAHVTTSTVTIEEVDDADDTEKALSELVMDYPETDYSVTDSEWETEVPETMEGLSAACGGGRYMSVYDDSTSIAEEWF